jgi:transposase
MRVTKAFRFELDPNAQQRIALAKHVGSARFAYNWGLALCLKAREERKKIPSTRLCSCCGRLSPRLPLSQREFRCAACGLVWDRDLNAALNLRNYGLARLKGSTASSAGSDACGDRLCGGTGVSLVSEHPVVEAGSGRSSRKPAWVK